MLKCECLFPQVPFSQICSNLGSVSSISWIIRQVQKAFGGSWWRGAVGAEFLIICRDMGSRRSRRPSVTEGLPLHQRDVCDGWSLIWQQVPESPWDINQPGAATADAAAAPISAHFTAVSSAAAAFFFYCCCCCHCYYRCCYSCFISSKSNLALCEKKIRSETEFEWLKAGRSGSKLTSPQWGLQGHWLQQKLKSFRERFETRDVE